MDNDNSIAIASAWQTKCGAVRASGARAARLCGGTYADLIRRRTDEFCEQATPKTDAELSKRGVQSTNLTGIFGSITSAWISASKHPRVASQIWTATKTFSDSVTMTDYTSAASMDLTSEIFNILSSDR